jgi:hypothetical protein
MSTSKWFVSGPHDDAPLTADRAASMEWFAPVGKALSADAQMMAEYLMDAEVGHAGAVSARKPLPAHTVKMSGADLADFEADRRQQLMHDRIAVLRQRAINNGGR